MTDAIRPYTRPVPRAAVSQPMPPTRREPAVAAPTPATPLSPNAAWLDKCAEHWQAQGHVLLWHYSLVCQRYVGFTVMGKDGFNAAEIWMFEK